jgi:hypothetical protein
MAYKYRFIPASMSIIPKAGTNPKNVYTELFQETLNEQFYNASNWWTIYEETSVGSQSYEEIDVRISHVINSETGLKLGDDWKTLLFQDVNHPISLGKQYIFDNNVWLTINTEIIKNLTGTCTIRRCNNTLRWIDEPTGAYYEEPCIIEYMVKEPRNYFTQGSPFSTPGGFLHIEMQFNERSNLINENQRFLFGNPKHWVCYKVIGTGINDFRNQTTYDNESAKILTLDLIADFINEELDDIDAGVADVHTNLYTITLNIDQAEGAPTDTIQLIPSVTYNGRTVSRSMAWESSDSEVATVNTSGLVTLITTGSSIITASINTSSSAIEHFYTSASALITVSASPTVNSTIIVFPDINYILEGSSRTYSVYLYENDVQQPDTFIFSCSGSNVPPTSYTFQQIDGNNFKVTNILRDNLSYLPIECSLSGSVVRTYNIYLKGAW